MEYKNGRGVSSKPQQGKGKLESAHKDVDQVVDIMRDNVDALMERGNNLKDLEKIAGGLEDAANGFGKTTRKIEQKEKQKRNKMCAILVGISILIFGVSAALIYFTFFK